MAAKKRKKKRLNSNIRALILLAVSAVLLLNVGSEVLTTIRLKQDLAEAKERLAEVESENDYLTSEKLKLQDPDYVESYARSNYMLSKDDEQIFFLPDKDTETQNK